MCDNDLNRFLKEKGKLGLNEMLVQAQNVLEAHELDERKVGSYKQEQGPQRLSQLWTHQKPS